jgi:hypothetical protein
MLNGAFTGGDCQRILDQHLSPNESCRQKKEAIKMVGGAAGKNARIEASGMSTREALDRVLQTLPEERVREVLDFAEFLRVRDAEAWRQFGQTQLARAYGSDEPEYSDADLKREQSP